jgi:hypothetical protein
MPRSSYSNLTVDKYVDKKGAYIRIRNLFVFASILFIAAFAVIFISLHSSLRNACETIPDILDDFDTNHRGPRVIRIGEPHYVGRATTDIVQLPLRLEMPLPKACISESMQKAA